MARLAPLFYAAFALLLLAGSALSSKTYYGKAYTHPFDRTQYIKPYHTTAENFIGSDLIAVGVVWTVGMLDRAEQLPMQSKFIPTATDNFPYEGIDIPLNFTTQEKGTRSRSPFQFVRVTYSRSGYPVGGNARVQRGVYDKRLWSLGFYYSDQASVNEFWKRNSGQFPCLGMTKDAFLASEQPVASQCFPSSLKFSNTGDAINGLGTRLQDFGSEEWRNPSVPQSFTSSLFYGQFNGQIQYLNPMISADTLRNYQSSAWKCWPVNGAPEAFPIQRLHPAQFCIKRVNGKVPTMVLELRGISVRPYNWLTVSGGNCQVSNFNAATSRSYFPDDYASKLPTSKLPTDPAICSYPKP